MQVSEFRRSNDARIPFGIIKDKILNLPEASTSYGRKNRAQTPVNQIIGNNFGTAAGQHLQARYA